MALGGLYILGTERHESRRIDNQLRGRAGRQGDPGTTRFYVSLEDELMRRFGADRISGMMEKLSPEDDMPIEAKLITRQIESAQRRVEAVNFDTRKNVLRYDDVMNKQREIIYGQRRQVLMGEDLSQSISDMIRQLMELVIASYAASQTESGNWDLEGLSREVSAICGRPRTWLFKLGERPSPEEIENRVLDFAYAAYAEKEAELTAGGADMREIERVILLRTVDSLWMDHIDAMDQLKQGIGLRAYGQKDPVVAYTNEGFDMFDAMVAAIRDQTIRTLFRIQLRSAPVEREQLAKPVDTAAPDGNRPTKKTEKKIGRNDPCPCGSGKKYKNCCGRDAK